MPIVNGVYVNDSLPNSRDAQSQVFGDYSRRDMSDYSAAAYNYLMKQQEQAYNLELWHLQNEYNSPAAQMKRYQDAGLSPWLIYGQQNTATAPQSASAPSFRSSGTASRAAQQGIAMVGQVMNAVRAARETYDYLAVGRDEHLWNRNLLIQKGQAQSLENMFNEWLLGLTGDDSVNPDAPRRKMYEAQIDTNLARYDQLVAAASAIPDSVARTKALTALDNYRLLILQGQSGALMKIKTGNATLDSFIQMLGFYLLGK